MPRNKLLQLRRSTTSGQGPPSDLVAGEPAVNLADEKMWIGVGDGSAFEISSKTPPLPGLPIHLPPGITDYVVPLALSGTAATTLALTASRVYWMPFVLTASLRITSVAINVTTAGAGTVAIGIYAANLSMQPSNLLFSTAGLDTGTTGIKQATGLTWNLAPGLYWLAVATSGAPTIRAIALAAARALALPSLGTANTVYWFTSGSTLPSNAPTTGYSAINGAAVPAVGMQYQFI
ncbi:MAG: hypothetical protein RMK51_03620 [Meiothermus sp.]|uniref:hypothetical protein n=2 Tax=Meiothermus sp. TaxID=1955249 RepID=UPI00298EE301|nr:hypothetical protein [Meiothermus sp.]MDW8424997.1 hypothetical protein [Meiothermus sp.]